MKTKKTGINGIDFLLSEVSRIKVKQFMTKENTNECSRFIEWISLELTYERSFYMTKS